MSFPFSRLSATSRLGSLVVVPAVARHMHGLVPDADVI